jgi:uncharacterized protein YggE
MAADGLKEGETSERKKEAAPARQPIAPGVIVIDATVHIVFELLD